MKRLGNIFSAFELIITDGASLCKIILAPFLIMSAFTALFSVASLISYFILNDEKQAFELFYGYMNLNNSGLIESLRLTMATFNWFSLSVIILFGFYSILKYLKDTIELAEWNNKIAVSKKIKVFPEKDNSNNSNQYKQAGNS